MEDKILMQLDCITIRVGNDCKDVHLPEGKSKDCCLQIICHEGKVINLIAESVDDFLAWETALRDAKTKSHILPQPLLYDDAVLGPVPPYSQFDAPPPYGYDQYPGGYPVQGSQVLYTSDGQAYASYPYPPQETESVLSLHESSPSSTPDPAALYLPGTYDLCREN
ncbi:unnamed protein product [Ranitomeya imitator]|uniref:Pleckstrin homology domain-containing family B member 2 n=1 Tax=Ranitomeya imitator TaxID=111125 RepID=A0ABN9KUH7_9NEOB|nr:unnamed protein product [Ranitomeya imitator]